MKKLFSLPAMCFSFLISSAYADTLVVSINATVGGGVDPAPACTVTIPTNMHFGELSYSASTATSIQVEYSCTEGTELQVNRTPHPSYTFLNLNNWIVAKLTSEASDDVIDVRSTEDLALVGTGSLETASMEFKIYSGGLTNKVAGEYSGEMFLNVIY